MRGFAVALCVLLSVPLLAAPTQAQTDLDGLLQQVREGRREDRARAREREAAFLARRDEQARLLREATAARDAARQRSEALRARFEAQEAELARLTSALDERLGGLGELVSTARLVAGETRAELDLSLVSAQFPGRGEALAGLADGAAFPDLDRLRDLWWTLLHEMTESGRVRRFQAEVASPDGRRQTRSVVRVGPFTAVSDGRFLHYQGGQLRELARQPARGWRRSAAALEAGGAGLVAAPLDPSRGALLAILVEAPTLAERVRQGGPVGVLIGIVGAMGLLLAVLRGGALLAAGRRIRAQLGAEPGAKPSSDNALGRILACADAHPDASAEALELHLEEAVAREAPRLERGLSSLRVLSVVAPLLGLLGTVTGMIETFQMITLFGAGDPRIMAGGISEALVTTLLGLAVAIPLTLLHGWLRDRSHGLLDVLEEQSAGLVARRVESREGAPPRG